MLKNLFLRLPISLSSRPLPSPTSASIGKFPSLSSPTGPPILRSAGGGRGSHSQPPLNPIMAAQDVKDPRIEGITSSIRVIPDFPKPGIMFHDITTLLLDTKAFKDAIDLFVERYKGKDISVVAGVEAR